MNRLETSNLVLQEGLHVHVMWYSSAHNNLIMYEMTIWCKLINMTCVSWFGMMAGAIWLHFNDLRVNLVVMHYFLAIEIAILSGASTRWWIFAKVNTDANAEDEEMKYFSVRKGYHIMLLWIAWDVYPLWCTLLDCAVVAFIRVISQRKNIK